MPVDVLLCEGVDHSPDVRVLNKLLAGLCTVEPSGSKHRMEDKILIRRRVSPTSVVMGLRDPDFDRAWTAPSDVPETWSKATGGGPGISLGWRWSRKEIENYLIDPAVVAPALGVRAPPPVQYQQVLDRAADRLSAYTAARVALTRHRIHRRQLPNRWGKPRGSDKYPFPENLKRKECRKRIRWLVALCSSSATLDAAAVLRDFQTQYQQHRPSTGLWRMHFLHTYGGKDLLLQMENDLQSFGFYNFAEFRERILLGIRDTSDDIAFWLPEWNALKNEIQTYIPR